MLRCLTLALMLLPWLITTAEAGAWPRDKGQTFLATSGQMEGPDEFGLYRQSFTLYAEYGLTERVTLGLDLGGDTLRMTKSIAFARWPIGRAGRKVRLAFEIGLGEVDETAALRPGLSLGRGLTLWGRHGWAAFDGRAVVFGDSRMTLESDITFGLNTTQRSKAILQLQTGRPSFGRAYSRFVPSFVYETKPGAHLEFGVILPFSGGGERGVKLGLWRQF
ncbi:hypothetical protein [Roseovarius sp. 217]|uniref:hypothetical protein n=1 Tax=Roseovarius sp. (strain 217) TaxID=314264 RepID=UPI0000685B8F|nr:hypothetical protein [Roseovarius sp. 217]EAQ27163.1 hypothetical protein ROS217_21592 [Roseovarius sp. 217]